MIRVIKDVPSLSEAQMLIGATVRGRCSRPVESYAGRTTGVVSGVTIDAEGDLAVYLGGQPSVMVAPDWCGASYWIEVLEEPAQ